MQNDLKNVKRTALLAAFWVLIAFIVLTVGTYAWFSRGGTITNIIRQTVTETVTETVPGAPGNNYVHTGSAKGKVGAYDVKLQFSELGGDSFIPKDSVPIVQVNGADFQFGTERLMPVSTADLRTFIYNSFTTEDRAEVFSIQANEEHYFHGRFYMRAVPTRQGLRGTMRIFFDGSTGQQLITCTTTNGNLQNVLRVGMIFDNDYENPYIFDVSSGAQGNSVNNTYLNGTQMSGGYVLTADDSGQIISVPDPSTTVNDYSLTVNSDGSLPSTASKTPLLKMRFNEIHQVDVFVYMEGCDPECIEDVELQTFDMQIPFYGIG